MDPPNRPVQCGDELYHDASRHRRRNGQRRFMSALLLHPSKNGQGIAQSIGATWFGVVVSVVAVALACYAGSEIGFAHKIAPHNISALWPTGAILFSVLLVVPLRHWWAYVLAAYLFSVVRDA